MARGDPLVNNGKKTNKLFSVCMYILIVEACERLCYYTIYGGQVYFLRDAGCDFAALGDGEYCMSTSVASSIRSCFRLLAYVFPIFGGYLADNIFGRYNTILWFTLAYVIGVVLMAVGALPAIVDTKAGPIIYLVGGFVFTAIGTGAIKPNLSILVLNNMTPRIQLRQNNKSPTSSIFTWSSTLDLSLLLCGRSHMQLRK